MLSTQTLLALSSWLKHTYAAYTLNPAARSTLKHYGDEIAEYFEHILQHNEYSAAEFDNAIKSIKYLLLISLAMTDPELSVKAKRERLQAKIMNGEYNRNDT